MTTLCLLGILVLEAKKYEIEPFCLFTVVRKHSGPAYALRTPDGSPTLVAERVIPSTVIYKEVYLLKGTSPLPKKSADATEGPRQVSKLCMIHVN